MELKPSMELAAKAAGKVLLKYFGKTFEVREKLQAGLVTNADLEAEAAVIKILRKARPDFGFLAEESGQTAATKRKKGENPDSPPDGRWIIDPLDGTTNFAHGFPHFAVSIASEDADGLRVGVVLEPITQRLFAAARGMGATLNGSPLRASKTPDLNAALLATGFPYDRRTNPDNNVHRVAHLIRRCQGIRRAGAAALDLAYVAAGWLDGYWEDRLKPWDLAAGALLGSEAGGRASDFDLGPLSLQSGRCVASNGHFHEQLAAAVLSAPALRFSEPETTP